MIFKIVQSIKTSSLILVLICLSINTWAQDPLYSQYHINSLTINPAYAGSKNSMSLMLQARQQWVGFEGAPSTQTFTAHSPIRNKKVGLGFSLINDNVGPATQTLAFFSYSYRIKLSRETNLFLGISGGINNYQIDYNQLDNASTSNDNAYANDIYKQLLPNVGAGLYFIHKNLFAGFSSPKLIDNKINIDSPQSKYLNESQQYYLMSGTTIKLSESLTFKPSFLATITAASPVLMDLNLNAIIADKLWIGAMYRINNAYGANVQFQITQQFRVGYAYEKGISELQYFNNGSHEIFLKFDLDFKKARVYSPRNL